MSDDTTATDTATPTGSSTLTYDDLAMVVKAIDYAADQGAFKGWQVIETVLGLRGRINAFLADHAPAPATDDATPAPDATATAA